MKNDFLNGKVYIGKTLKRETNYGDIISVGLTRDNIAILIDYLDQTGEDRVNIDIKTSRAGEPYAEINLYKVQNGKTQKKPGADEIEFNPNDELPF